MKLKYPLQTMYFAADEAGSAGSSAPKQESAEQPIDYDKLADIVSKRSQSAEDSALKGYLKEQGLTGTELSEAISTFKSNKAKKAQEASQHAALLEQQNEQLRNQLQTMTLNNAIAEQAAGLNVSTAKLPYLNRLIDTTGLVSDKGEIVSDKVKEAIQKVLKDFPEMAGTTQTGGSNNGIHVIGGSSSGNQGDIQSQLDAAFGIRKK